MLRGYKSRNLFRVSGQAGDFYLTPTDAKISLYTAQDGTVKFKLHGIQNDEKQLQRPFHEYKFNDKEQKNLQETGNLGEVVKSKTRKVENKFRYSSAGTGKRTNWNICVRINCASRTRFVKLKLPTSKKKILQQVAP